MKHSRVDLPELVPLFALPLGRAGLGYMVTGAVAAAVYGEPRLTLDLDLILSLGAREVRRLAQLFPSEEFYVPPEETLLAEAARLRHGHFNLMHLGSGLRADVYVLGNDPLHVWAFERRREVQVSGQPAWIAPPEYVILRKLQYFREAGSPKHLRDIAWMLRVSEDLIDLPLLETKVGELGVQPEWERAQAHPLDG